MAESNDGLLLLIDVFMPIESNITRYGARRKRLGIAWLTGLLLLSARDGDCHGPRR